MHRGAACRSRRRLGDDGEAQSRPAGEASRNRRLSYRGRPSTGAAAWPSGCTRPTADFEARFAALLAAKREVAEDVEAAVARDRRRCARSAATRRSSSYTAKFDRLTLTAGRLRVAAGRDRRRRKGRRPRRRDALRFARDRIEAFHRRQMPADDRYTDAARRRARHPLDRHRGGRPLRARRHRRLSEFGPDERRAGAASPASSASSWWRRRRTARSTRWCSPPPGSPASTRSTASAAPRRSPRSPTARRRSARSPRSSGPGNAYVAAAKRLVFGTVGIDMIAGPSEVLVVADARQRPRLDRRRSPRPGRARHRRAVDPGHRFRRRSPIAVAAAVERQLKTLPRGEIAAASWRDYGAIIVVDVARRARWTSPTASRRSISSSPSPIRRRCSSSVRNAGAVFLGRHTPEVIGDYVGGPNHVLPTARSARFSSGLSVLDFLKRTSLLKLGPEQLARARRPGDHARRGRGARRPRPLGRDPPQPDGRMMRPAGRTAAGRLIAVELDADSLGRSRTFIDSRARAPRSTISSPRTRFRPGRPAREPFASASSVVDRKLVFDVADADGAPVVRHILSLTPARTGWSRTISSSARATTRPSGPRRRRARSRRSTWAGAASTTRAPKS